MKFFPTCLAALAFCPAILPFARAGLILYEPFDYAAESSLGGLGGGTWLGSATWTDNSPTNDLIANSGLSYDSLKISGYSALLTGATQDDRDISPAISGANGGTTWISFLLRLKTTEPAAAGAYLTIRPNSTGQAAQFGVFLDEGNFFFGIGASQGTVNTPVLSSVTLAAKVTYFLVAGVTWNTATNAAEQISLYVNPALGASPPASANASRNDLNIVTSAGTNRIFNILLAGGGAGNEWIFDEIRVGDDFADVVPLPEPSALALGILGSAGLLRRRPARPRGTPLR